MSGLEAPKAPKPAAGWNADDFMFANAPVVGAG